MTSDGSVISGGQDSLYRSTDDGQTWSPITDNSPFHWNTAQSLFTTSKSTVLMGVGGISPQWYGVYRSTDNGFGWSITSGLPTGDGGDLDCVVNFDEMSDGTVFAATKDAGIYKSTDDGQNWQKIPVPTTPVGVGDPSILASNNLGLFVGDGNNIISDGLFRSTDDGSTWSVFGFKGYQIGAMMQLDTNEVLANINGSIYILTMDFVTAINEPPHRPATFTLSQNYPNPFNPTTTIQFSVSKRSLVTLSIYNVLGQLVKTLISETKPPGTYELKFDATKLSSGVYFYRISTKDYAVAKAMVFIK